MQTLPFATPFFSILTIIVQVTIVLILFCLVIRNKYTSKVLAFFKKKALIFAFSIAFVCTFGSLYYSEIVGFTPCKLCWYQRILMYPQVILFALAYVKQDKNVSLYSIVLSILGAAVALYHYLIQIGTIDEILPCTTVGYSVSCAEKFEMTFGYITIPMMSLSAFLLLLLLMILVRKGK